MQQPLDGLRYKTWGSQCLNDNSSAPKNPQRSQEWGLIRPQSGGGLTLEGEEKRSQRRMQQAQHSMWPQGMTIRSVDSTSWQMGQAASPFACWQRCRLQHHKVWCKPEGMSAGPAQSWVDASKHRVC